MRCRKLFKTADAFYELGKKKPPFGGFFCGYFKLGSKSDFFL
ncbi:hypothetical protein ApDm4_0239 [Acetobacter pomorum]|nr:hypothetical protein ApDm4_0239 [Acetobacter pomorum]